MIRDAVAGDLPAVRAIARAAYAPFVAAIGREPAPMRADFAGAIEAAQMRVAGDPAAGYCVSYREGAVWHVENLAVMPGGQGSGLGSALLDDAEARGRAAGCAAVELYTNVAMSGALALYPRRGYRETGRGEEAGFHRVYFRKVLA